MRMSVALIGFMGTGKSTVGKKLAASLGFRFIETDRLIERRAGMSISEIFRTKGEKEFRDIEEEVIDSAVAEAQNSVIACGGGVVLRPDNVGRLKKSAIIIYLKTEERVLRERLARSRKRPLLERPDWARTVSELLAYRQPLYEAAADIIINTGNRQAAAVVREISDILNTNES